MKPHMCPKCGKSLANRHNLSRHKKNCRFAPYNIPTSGIPTFNVNDGKMFIAKRHGAVKETGPRNPKIQTLLDEIINDTPDDVDVASQSSLPTVAVKQTLLPTVPQVIPHQTLPNPFPSIVTPKPPAEVFPSIPMKKLPTTNYQLPHEVVNTKPRTKGVIIGFSNGESDVDEQCTDEETEGENEDDSDSIDDIKPNGEDMEIEIEEFTLPDTIEEVRDRFNQLYVEFMRHNKHEHTNELMFLLDEMLRQGAITPTEYAQLNTSLTEAADLKTAEAEKEEDSDDGEQNLTKSTVDYIIQHDKEELLQLMEELKDDIDEEFMDIVLGIEKLLEVFFEETFLDGEPIRPQINELLNKLETSVIPKSNQHRIKVWGGITKNRYRVEEIIQRLMDAEDKDQMSTILQMLVRAWPTKRYGLISCQ